MNWKNLEDYPLKDLQKMWLDYFDKPYCSNSKAFFVSRIGYRLQELKYGGLKPETKNMLVKMFNSKEYRNPIFIKDERLPSVGTILVKIHNGVEHRVRIKGAAQIEYNGKIYKTLTAVARQITGRHCSGYSFFGLSDKRG
ncbi:MAG: DUF2924 domain-containing protein [Alphaproteobacteria bacterium]|nr:DUF2924 domain-containing protein [Alphaproteobacteria bacterium]